MAPDGYTQYQVAAAETAGPAQLVLMLYDGALARIERAEEALTGMLEPAVANEALTRAQAIVTELSVSLDHDAGGDIAGNLASLYQYVYDLLVHVNVTKRADRLPEATRILTGLRDAWSEACCNATATTIAGVPG